jgi:hypothetical protein
MVTLLFSGICTGSLVPFIFLGFCVFWELDFVSYVFSAAFIVILADGICAFFWYLCLTLSLSLSLCVEAFALQWLGGLSLNFFIFFFLFLFFLWHIRHRAYQHIHINTHPHQLLGGGGLA